ncbi:MAG TPA: hypothetical protein VMU99_09250, partial [Acidimicrobiales bacterium]|nr:hypothetical protein [Acidimicrobiales bacterium]
MPGMGGGLGNSAVSPLAKAFHQSLLHQWFIVLAVLVALTITWNVLRFVGLRARAHAGHRAIPLAQTTPAEPAARRFLRVALGGLWLVDGLLQSQSAMPALLANAVIRPLALASPSWVARLTDHGISSWNNHPVTAATAVFWIQIGIALWLLSASRGPMSRLGGYTSACWALMVWIFGEIFGGLFAPGFSWLFGAPGAALVYFVIGTIIGLPDRRWYSSRLGLGMIRSLGAFLIVMAFVQALPGRGFWHGRTGSAPFRGTLPQMMNLMAKSPQPALFRSAVEHVASLSLDHGFAFNLTTVLLLGVLGCAFLLCTVREGTLCVIWSALPLLPFVFVYLALSLFVWVTIQDLGVFGGIGTDPNSMIPISILLIGGYLATSRGTPIQEVGAIPSTVSLRNPVSVLCLQIERDPLQSLRTFIAFGALFITIFGAVPMIDALLNTHR